MIPMIQKPSKNGQGHVHSKLIPAHVVCLDIETAHASQKAIEDAVAMYKPPSNIKDEDKIEAAGERYAEKVKDKDALLDAAPIACISVRTDKTEETFSAMDKKAFDGKVYFISPANERKMLVAFRDWMDQATDENTVLIGFNILAFDLPRLRAAFMRQKLKLPQILAPQHLDAEKKYAIDVMLMFVRGFTADKYKATHISLREVEHRLGLPEYKEKISGADVPDMIARGEFKKVLLYCTVDTGSTLEAYWRMTSASREME